MLTNSSGSYMSAKVMPGPSTDELNGLNWHVQVDPLTLTITTLPPTVPLFAGVDELLDELPPQPTMARQTAANITTHMERFIDILRFPLGPSFGKYLNKRTLSPLMLGFN